MIIAQISDTHIVAPGKLFRCPVQGSATDSERVYREFDTAAYLAQAVAALNALLPRPDIAVITGDLVDNGDPEEYEHLRAVLRPLAMDARWYEFDKPCKYIALGRRVAEEHLEEIKSLVNKRTVSHEPEIADNPVAGLA